MRISKTIVGAGLAIVGLILVAWGLRDHFSPGLRPYVLLPSAISGDRAGGIRASFILTTATRQVDPTELGQGNLTLSDGFLTNHEGGACIVLAADDLSPLSRGRPNCNRDIDCGTGAYCEPESRRCWIKPPGIGDDACRKSRVEKTNWRPNNINPLPRDGKLDLSRTRLPEGRVRARVITCLETIHGTVATGCPNSGSQSFTRWGDITAL